MNRNMISYGTVTELPGNKASNEQRQRLLQRYCFASQFCNGKYVLEAACGSGLGLRHLAKTAKLVIAGDIDPENLKHARQEYAHQSTIQIKQFDAQHMPFSDTSLDVVILFEAIYYLEKPEKFIREAHRILKPNGILILGTVNKDWSEFNPSPFSQKYFSVPELNNLLKEQFKEIEFYGGFPSQTNDFKQNITSLIKRAAVRCGIMPKTMKGKEWLKGIFFGKLRTLVYETLEEEAEPTQVIPIPGDIVNTLYKVIYVIGYKNEF